MRSISILMYHSLDTSGSIVSVTPQDFANQMACASDLGFRGISLCEAVTHYESNGSWPDRCIVLTFDDAYANFYESALPTLVRHGFTATVFLISGHVGGRNDWGPQPAGLGTRAMLSWQQAAELPAAGIEIGAHTRTHLDLWRLSAEEAREEIVASRAEIESHLGSPVGSFAYPFGSVSRASLDIVKSEFRAGCTTELRRATSDPRHRLPRIDMYYIRARHTLRRLLTGQLDSYLAVRRAGRSVRHRLLRRA